MIYRGFIEIKEIIGNQTEFPNCQTTLKNMREHFSKPGTFRPIVVKLRQTHTSSYC